MTHKHPFMIGRELKETAHTLPVINPYNQEVFAEVSLAGTAEIDKAIELAVQTFEKTRSPAHLSEEPYLFSNRPGN